MRLLPLHGDPDGRLRPGVSLGVAFHQDAEPVQMEERGVPGLLLPDEQGEGGLRPFEMVSLMLEALDRLQDLFVEVGILLEVEFEFAGLEDHIRTPGQFRDHHPPGVAHRFGRDVFVRLRVLLDGADVHPPLVGERRLPDIGLVDAGRQVRHLVHVTRKLRQRGKALRRHAVEAHLQLQRREDRTEIGVAAPLPHPVDRPLHHRRARADRREGVGDRHVPVVVGVDSERLAHATGDLADDPLDVLRERSAVRVAQRDPVGPPLLRRLQGQEGVPGIGPVAVEEVLGVVDHLGQVRPEIRDRFADHPEVLLERRVDRLADVEIPALPEDAGPVGLHIDEAPEVRVLGRLPLLVTGRAERDDPARRESQAAGVREELEILGVGEWPSAFDVADAEGVQPAGDGQLVLQGQGDPHPLRPVAEGRVKDREAPSHVRSILPCRSGFRILRARREVVQGGNRDRRRIRTV